MHIKTFNNFESNTAGRWAVIAAIILAIGQRANGDTTIRVGDHLLLPNTAAQAINIVVEGDEMISGVDLFAQIGDGGLGLVEFGLPAGTSGPAISDVSFGTGTIFDGISDLPIDLSSELLPQTAAYTLALLGPVREVTADGLLAYLIVDTAGHFDGNWSLELSNVLPFSAFGGPHHTNFANSRTPIVENGSISIMTEPCETNVELQCGDLNGDGLLTGTDIDSLSQAVRAGTTNLFFDINADGTVDEMDRGVWVRDVKRTYFGDANLDGVFDSGDFVQVFQARLYEDTIPNNATWATGDWDGDADFTSGDFVLAFSDGGYERGPRVTAVPEPAHLTLAVLLAGLCMSRAGRVS